MRTIVTSSAYQLSAHFDGEWKDSYAPYFVRRFVRRLPAEMICDAISQATGVFNTISLWGSNERFPYDGKVKYVMQTRSPADLRGEDLQPMREMLIGFGQTNRDNLMVRDMTGNMTQAAILLNSKFAKERIKIQEGGRLHKLLNHNPPLPNGEIIEEMFLAFLARYPRPEEKALGIQALTERHQQGLQDLAWSLINKIEFIHNY